MNQRRNKRFGGLAALIAIMIAGGFMLSGCGAFNNAVADAMRALGASPGTVYNFGRDGQLVYQAHCRSLDFTSDDEFDRYNAKGDKIEESSVIALSCGDSIIKTVGFTTVYVSDTAQPALFANSQQFAKVQIENNDRGVPLVNFVWRSVKNNFTGTASVAQLCDQWNNPIMAFAGSVSGFGTEVDKSTMFQIDFRGRRGYVWISRGSYTVTDAALLS